MQDEKNISTSQGTSEDELAERLILLINHTGKQLDSLLKDIINSGDAMQNFFENVDSETLRNVQFLQQFSKIIMQGAMENMVNEMIGDMKQSGANCKDAFERLVKQMGVDDGEVVMIISEE